MDTDCCDICPKGDGNIDTDGDVKPDACDICPGQDDNIDMDGDGIQDGCECDLTVLCQILPNWPTQSILNFIPVVDTHCGSN